jgi:hypothetical protein
MAEVTPNQPKGGGAAVGGAILGGLLGLIVAVVLSVMGLAFTGVFDGASSSGRVACGSAIVTGIVLLAAAAGIGWLAWYMLVRNSSRSFGAGFLRGLSAIVAAFLLIPWPCSYTWAAFINFGACAR